MRTVLITLIGPDRTADLVVDADTPAGDLLPSLLAAGGVSTEAEGLARWSLAVMGKQPVAPEETLEQAGVLDGAVVVLRRDTELPSDAVRSSSLSGGPAGSPLERTRALLAQPGGGPDWRARLLPPQIPDAATGAEGARTTLEQAIRDAPLARCATIAVASPKGGVGKTTISILLAELLCGLRSETVLALDADVDYGSLGRVAPAHAGAKPVEARDAGVFDALAQGAVTFAELDRTLWRLPGGLRVVPSPRDPGQMARTDRATYARVIGNLQRLAGVLVVDCGTGLGQPGVQAAILACDQLVVMTDASGATASLVVEAMRLLERAGRPITVVCNRLRRGKQGSDDLLRLDALFPHASGLIGIPDEPESERALRGEFDWASAPRTLHQPVLELAALLALSWSDLGLGAAA
jgi:MinD-like ATPase involved in chromosome partitioning or flagellar assembly